MSDNPLVADLKSRRRSIRNAEKEAKQLFGVKPVRNTNAFLRMRVAGLERELEVLKDLSNASLPLRTQVEMERRVANFCRENNKRIRLLEESLEQMQAENEGLRLQAIRAHEAGFQEGLRCYQCYPEPSDKFAWARNLP